MKAIRDIYLGLGSNLGDRKDYIQRAISSIRDCNLEILATSDIENTKAVIVTDQPDFLNCVVKVRGDMSAHDLLAIVKDVEKSLGRIQRYEKGPREIDIDILLIGQDCIDTVDLVIPHPGIVQRGFVMRELMQIDPFLKDPRSGRDYSDLYAALCDKGGNVDEKTADK